MFYKQFLAGMNAIGTGQAQQEVHMANGMAINCRMDGWVPAIVYTVVIAIMLIVGIANDKKLVQSVLRS